MCQKHPGVCRMTEPDIGACSDDSMFARDANAVRVELTERMNGHESQGQPSAEQYSTRQYESFEKYWPSRVNGRRRLAPARYS